MAKLVMITGASTGLGEQLAYAFASRQMQLVLIGRNHQRLTQVARRAARLTAAPVAILASDLLNDQGKTVWHQCVARCGLPDILVNNAALPGFGAVNDLTSQQTQRIIQLNTLVPLTLSQLFIQAHYRDVRPSYLINLASAGAELALPYAGFHAASKAALLGFAQGTAFELQRTQINLMTVLPSLLATGHFQQQTQPYLKPQLAYLLSKTQLAPEKVAKKIVTRALQGQRLLRLPVFYQWLAPIIHLAPNLSRKVIAVAYRTR
ncbi:SDR family NAD(P)-dependent oxidoreductase [Loigolactobacillus binensis]|uniref:SDR family NAD(P)-dependent oxidoreductase n=1 Tax=Loigolactobacillus binensis TaxID=2559922 RepID=A0ABW3EE86_9LACO|nr:SDR family NAD(P)-dependent oxidoreductase [Loigolactobacillus binensis]